MYITHQTKITTPKNKKKNDVSAVRMFIKGEVGDTKIPESTGEVEGGKMPSGRDQGEGKDGGRSPESEAIDAGGPEVVDKLGDGVAESLIPAEDTGVERDRGDFKAWNNNQTLQGRLGPDSDGKSCREPPVPVMVRHRGQETIARHRFQPRSVHIVLRRQQFLSRDITAPTNQTSHHAVTHQSLDHRRRRILR